MDTDTVATFFALLILGGTAGWVVAAIRPSTRPVLLDNALQLTAVAAVAATAGSLYMSEVAGFVPCELCWMQRIAMYPLALILPMAAVRKDRNILRYALAISVIGLAISAYHVQLQLFPSQGSSCELANPCTARWVEAFGWMTIPQMALLSFASIVAITSLSIFTPNQESR